MRFRLSIMLLAGLLLLGAGCQGGLQKHKGAAVTTGPQFGELADTGVAPPKAPPPPWLLLPGDALIMAVFTDPPAREPPISIMDVIKEDGSITLLSNQVFSTTGKTRSELENEIRSYYAPRFSTNSVCLCNTDPPVYCVRGEVNSPGLQIRMRPTTVLKAVQSAGGFSQSANKKKVQLIRHGTKFIVNCAKAQQDSTADMEVVADDKIVVPRSVWK